MTNFFRYYDPQYGRFISQDPIGLLGGDNLYQFAPNAQGWTDVLGWSSHALGNSLLTLGSFRGKGKGRDGWTNGIFLPGDEATARSAKCDIFHRGSHQNYSDEVSQEVNAIRDKYEMSKKTNQDKSNALAAIQNLQGRMHAKLNQFNGKTPERLS